MFQNYALNAPKQCSARSGAMLCKVKSMLLLASGSYAFRLVGQCFWPSGALLLACRSYVIVLGVHFLLEGAID